MASAQAAVDNRDMMADLKNFINPSKHSRNDRTKIAIRLLTSLPPCRDAVLEHLQQVFDSAVHAHISTLEVSPQT